MQIPAADTFRLEPGPAYGPWWFANPPEASFTLRLPPGEIYDFFEDDPAPHEPSYALAAVVLGRLGELTTRAVEYLDGVVERARKGMRGEPYLISVECDARAGRVTLEMAWEADVYSAWSVTFAWADEARVHPVAMGYRVR
jgi:hypothetical protein